MQHLCFQCLVCHLTDRGEARGTSITSSLVVLRNVLVCVFSSSEMRTQPKMRVLLEAVVQVGRSRTDRFELYRSFCSCFTFTVLHLVSGRLRIRDWITNQLPHREIVAAMTHLPTNLEYENHIKSNQIMKLI